MGLGRWLRSVRRPLPGSGPAAPPGREPEVPASPAPEPPERASEPIDAFAAGPSGPGRVGESSSAAETARMKLVFADGSEHVPDDPQIAARAAYLARRIVAPPPPR